MSAVDETAAEPGRAGERTKQRSEVDAVRLATVKMLGAERRLRSRDHSGPGELTNAQIRALATLGRERAMTAGQLAKAADLNPASVTAMLDQLEAENVVQRVRGTEDRRLCNVSLTEQGEQLLERKLSVWYALWDDRFADFSAEELEIAERVIREIGEIYDTLRERREAQANRPS
jgi:DNA-binding MarR family transcriptional regulator